MTDIFLFLSMETFVPFAVVLSSKGFTADSASKWPLICMCAEMRAKVVGPSKAFRTECTLKRSRKLLLSTALYVAERCPFRSGEARETLSLV
jgi:hypothetical protein